MRKTTFTKIDKLLDALINFYAPEPIDDLVEDILYEEPERPSEIISACVNAIGVISEMDTAMMSKADENRIKKIRRKALRLTEISIDAIYDTNIEDNDTDS